MRRCQHRLESAVSASSASERRCRARTGPTAAASRPGRRSAAAAPRRGCCGPADGAAGPSCHAGGHSVVPKRNRFFRSVDLCLSCRVTPDQIDLNRPVTVQKAVHDDHDVREKPRRHPQAHYAQHPITETAPARPQRHLGRPKRPTDGVTTTGTCPATRHGPAPRSRRSTWRTWSPFPRRSSA